MQRNRKLLLVLLSAMVAAFCYGVVHLFFLRFKTGDVYPPYSSLRSDPLGTRALYESLIQLDAVSVQRNYQAISDFRSTRKTTFLYLGANPEDWQFNQEDFLKIFEKLAASGARLVFSFLPAVKQPDGDRPSESQAATPSKRPKSNTHPTAVEKKSELSEISENGAEDSTNISEASRDTPTQSQAENGCECSLLRKRWGVSFGYHQKVAAGVNHAFSVFKSVSDVRLPPVSWHTLLFFEDPLTPWKTIYAFDGRPVIIERAMGRGSIVFAADSFFFSNEALQVDRNPELLSWMVGPNPHIVFDEYHFGIIKTQGIAAMIRAYRLHWFFLGIAFLAILVAWKNSAHFIQPPATTLKLNQAQLASEKDYTHGLISLLRRNIAVKDILKVCAAEWGKSHESGEKIAPDKIAKLESMLNSPKTGSNVKTDLVSGYQKICEIMAKRKR